MYFKKLESFLLNDDLIEQLKRESSDLLFEERMVHYLVIGLRIDLNLLAEVDMVFEQRVFLLVELRLAMRVGLFEVGFDNSLVELA